MGVILKQNDIKPSSDEGLNRVLDIEKVLKQQKQLSVITWHTLHSGVYSRTILLPKGSILTGVLLKIPTTLIVSGNAIFTQGDDTKQVNGYAVLTASKQRKQAFISYEDTYITMCFSTSANTIEQAEKEFTDDYEQLLSRKEDAINFITITGE